MSSEGLSLDCITIFLFKMEKTPKILTFVHGEFDGWLGPVANHFGFVQALWISLLNPLGRQVVHRLPDGDGLVVERVEGVVQPLDRLQVDLDEVLSGAAPRRLVLGRRALPEDVTQMGSDGNDEAAGQGTPPWTRPPYGPETGSKERHVFFSGEFTG